MKLKLILILLLGYLTTAIAQENQVNWWAVELTRAVGRDIFDNNGIPYTEPVVVIVNATSNSRFYNTAYVQPENEFYVKFGVHPMMGFVRDDMKTYKPYIPNEPFSFDRAAEYASFNPITQEFAIKDTADLLHYLFKTVLYNGFTQDLLFVPDEAATLLGNKNTKLTLPKDTLLMILENHVLWPFLDDKTKEEVLNVMNDLPYLFSLPKGTNKSSIFLFVPQIEFGSLYGTELMVRYIPPVNLDEDIGDFTFWGITLKHSLSQYFPERWFDMAVQGAYQGTKLSNTVGETNAQFQSLAQIYNANIHFSKNIDDIFEVYSGFSYEYIDIETSFDYFIPIEQQISLGLVRPETKKPDPANGYPGDQNPQHTTLIVDNTNYKWLIGLHKEIGNLSLFVDYSISQFNIFSGGIVYRFDIMK